MPGSIKPEVLQSTIILWARGPESHTVPGVVLWPHAPIIFFILQPVSSIKYHVKYSIPCDVYIAVHRQRPRFSRAQSLPYST